MGARRVVVVVALGATAVLGLAPPASAQPAEPSASEVAITQYVPGVLSLQGDFPVRLSLLQPTAVCGFDLLRSTAVEGELQYLRYVKGVRTTSVLSRTPYTQFTAFPQDCQGSGGEEVRSQRVHPRVYDDDLAVVTAGTGARVATTGAYGGDLLRTTSTGARVRYQTSDAYNNALAVTTGPEGGTGAVYVDGIFRAMLSFYSPTWQHRQLRFDVGGSSPAHRTIEVRQTGLGAGGGSQMYLDALTEIGPA